MANAFRITCTSIVPLLLPHPHTFDLQRTAVRVLPSWVPRVLCGPKFALRQRARVYPRLTVYAVLEPSVRSSHGNIEDQIEVFIKWSRVTTLRPRINNRCAIGLGERKLASFPERSVELVVEYLQQATVEVGI